MESVDGRDRLSEMPDEIIIQILSCMPIVYAVRTMLLRRFGDLWTWVHTLKLDMDDFFDEFYLNRQCEEEEEEDENERMIVFFRNVLILHKSPPINIFDICVKYNSSDESVKPCAYGEAKTWVRFALDRQAKELILCDMSDWKSTTNLLVHNFSSQYLVKLVLVYCDLDTEFEVNLPSLKKLSTDNCGIGDEELVSFLCGCPSLQELEIEDLYYLEKLNISAPNIDKLSLVCHDWKPLSFDCSNLKTLELDVCHGIVITEISSVRDIYVKNYPGNKYNNEKLHTTPELFYGKLDAVEVLHLSRYVSHEFLDTVQHLHLLQHRWKRVVLELRKFDQVCLDGIQHLTRSLRNLEELTIYPSWKAKPAEELEFVKRMLSFPRASTSARILFA